VKTRYRQTDIPCTVTALDDDRIEVRFDEPVAAVTPGQSAVFYRGEVCLGGGIIEQRCRCRSDDIYRGRTVRRFTRSMCGEELL
jgi:tRNA-specific 2-thiouridylase